MFILLLLLLLLLHQLLLLLLQVYGFGKSEEFPGEFMKATGSSPIIATKYAPQPWRLNQGSVPAACKASLERLQLQQMGLYIQHW
jgi:aryl-alcohol dehydrogenase-like predicted oxidoreductase